MENVILIQIYFTVMKSTHLLSENVIYSNMHFQLIVLFS